MLTRLKISGFKNLIDVDLRLGPFTCIAGANGVGKSNLFDAIRFLSLLSDRPLNDAASCVRDESGKTPDIRSLFTRYGDEIADEMSFKVEMIVPREGEDDLGQIAEATTTFLNYSLSLGYRSGNHMSSLGSLELLKEELVRIKKTDARNHILFHNDKDWLNSVITGRRGKAPFISTVMDGGGSVIRLHQDGVQGKALSRSAEKLPRTVLSSTNAAESPTALLARREMQSWRLLQLEPSALRQPDSFSAPSKLGSDGSHLPATLYRLAQHENTGERQAENILKNSSRVYAQVANRLSELIDDVRAISIDRDEKRELLTLFVEGKDNTRHAARALSDGTLRFLALAIILQDPESAGLLCMEEPENGIHPERIPAMIRLLNDIATDPGEPSGLDNPLRQIIVNTHSPSVVQQVTDDSLMLAELREVRFKSEHSKGAVFSCLLDTWRADRTPSSERPEICDRGKLLGYLNPALSKEHLPDYDLKSSKIRRRGYPAKSKRVIDREDIQPLKIPFPH